MNARDVRSKSKLTQQQLADILGIPIRTWQRYEERGRMPYMASELLRIKLKERGIDVNGLN